MGKSRKRRKEDKRRKQIGRREPKKRLKDRRKNGIPDVSLDSGVAQTISQTPTPAADQEETITNSIGMEFVLIPADEFDMGSPEDEEGSTM